MPILNKANLWALLTSEHPVWSHKKVTSFFFYICYVCPMHCGGKDGTWRPIPPSNPQLFKVRTCIMGTELGISQSTRNTYIAVWSLAGAVITCWALFDHFSPIPALYWPAMALSDLFAACLAMYVSVQAGLTCRHPAWPYVCRRMSGHTSSYCRAVWPAAALQLFYPVAVLFESDVTQTELTTPYLTLSTCCGSVSPYQYVHSSALNW